MSSKYIHITPPQPLYQLLSQGSYPVWVCTLASLKELGLQIRKPSNSFLLQLLLVTVFHHNSNSPKTSTKCEKTKVLKSIYMGIENAKCLYDGISIQPWKWMEPAFEKTWMDLEMVVLNEISQVYRKKMFSDLTHTMNFQLTNFAEVERMLLI